METFLVLAFGILTIALWLWVIIDITRSRRTEPLSMTVWFWLVLFFPVIGSILYFLLKDRWSKRRTREFSPTFNKKA